MSISYVDLPVLTSSNGLRAVLRMHRGLVMCRTSCIPDGFLARPESLETRPEACDWTDALFTQAVSSGDQNRGHSFTGNSEDVQTSCGNCGKAARASHKTAIMVLVVVVYRHFSVSNELHTALVLSP